MKRIVSIGLFMLVAWVWPLNLKAADSPARVVVGADKPLFCLTEMMIGANMEDLHYQMVGGFDSQLIHGESFFEPSPTQLAAQFGLVDGFANCGGGVKLSDGVLAMGKGTRLTSTTRAARAAVELSAGAGAAGLAICVSPNNSDNKWEWYSGYTAQVAAGRVVLAKAERANKHRELASVPVKADEWTKLAMWLDGNAVVVSVNGKEAIRHRDERPLPPGLWAVIARDAARFRGEFAPNPLLKTPGDAISLRWARVQTGSAGGRFSLETQGAWFQNSPSQAITFSSGEGEWGIDNAGLKRWGIHLVEGRPYEGYLRVKASQPTEFWVSLRKADGTVLAEEKHLAGPGEFAKVAFTLTPSATDGAGRFAVTLKKPGSVTLGYAFLQAGDWGRYKGLPIRKDLAEALLAQGIGVLRFNGGMIEVPGYRWKNMRGPRDQRRPYDGFYDRYCSSGFGPAEAVAFGKAAGLPVIPALNLEETPEDVADFVATCKPEYYQVANESRFDRNYVDKFKAVASAVWKVSPNVTLITTSTRVSLKDTDDEAGMRKKLQLHLELAEFARQNGRRIIFDSHSFNGAAAVDGIAAFARQLQRLAPDANLVSVGILEFNAGAFDFQRGLNHAFEMNAAHRAGDVIRGVGTPNVSQPWGVYQTDWKAVLWTQGNIYYTPDKVWFQAAYYVDQMIRRYWAPAVVACEFAQTDNANKAGKAEKTFDILAAKTADGKRLVLRAVNLAAEPVSAEISVRGFVPASPTAGVEELTGDVHDFNTREQPEKIKPVRRSWQHQMKDGRIRYAFPANSFTIIELE